MIRLLVMDVDGTLTDGKIYIGNNGEEIKAFNIKDGMGIVNAINKGIIPIIITGRQSQIVVKRCDELGIKHLYQGINNKIEKLKEILEETNFSFENVAYIGDDINDIECLKMSGLSGCPNNAVVKVKSIVNYVCSLDGGSGCVREFIEYILRERNLNQ